MFAICICYALSFVAFVSAVVFLATKRCTHSIPPNLYHLRFRGRSVARQQTDLEMLLLLLLMDPGENFGV